MSTHGRLRAAYDAAVFCALALAEANRVQLNSEDPEEILRVLPRYLGHHTDQDVILLSQLHRKTDPGADPFMVTDADATDALEIAIRIQETATHYIHNHGPI